jgi:hypothetical protein
VSSAADYAWFEVTELGLAVASCLTFVKDVPAAEVARRLGGTEIARMDGLARFERYRGAVTVPPQADGEDEACDYSASTGREFAAVCDLTGGAFMLETYSFLGVTDDVLRRLSAGTSVAVVYSTEHNDSRFVWAEDGDIRVAFDPFHAGWREGSTPDALILDLAELGFHLSDEDPGDPRWVFDDKAAQRALALAHRLTGVHLTEDTLKRPTYLALSVPSARSAPAEADLGPAPPLYFHDVAPTVDQTETMDLNGDGLIVAAIGESITVQPWAQHGYDAAVRYTVRSVLQAPHADPEPDEVDTVWLLVDVEAVGVHGQVQAQPHDFAFVAADRSRYWPTGVSDKPQLEMTSLLPGQRVSGLVLFQVPADVPAHGKIVVKTLGDEDDIPWGYWLMAGSPARYEGPEKYPW